MKQFLITFLFSSLLLAGYAQVRTEIDTSIKFDQRYTKCERKWVVINKRDTDKYYMFGFIYLDPQAAFTFDLKGNFSVDKNNRYAADTTITKNGSIKYRIASNWNNVALLPAKHFKELGIKPQPDWIKYYYSYTDTVAHNYRWGFIYNDVGESAIALTYLEPAYRMKQHAPGVEFELAFAYNATQRFDDAIRVLASALENKPDESYLYKELAYAYMQKKDYDNAITTYKKGLQYFPDKQSEAKGEMAFNMASAYKTKGNQDEYKNWMLKAKEYTPQTSAYYKRITDAGF